MTSAEDPPITHEYIWFAGQPIAQITTTTGDIAWYFNDHVGTPVLQTNASAEVIWRVEREPYGTPHCYRAGIERHQPLAFPRQEERGSESEIAYHRGHRGLPSDLWWLEPESNPRDPDGASVPERVKAPSWCSCRALHLSEVCCRFTGARSRKRQP